MGAAPRQWGKKELASTSTDGLAAAYRADLTTPTRVLEEIASRIETDQFGKATNSPFICLNMEQARADAKESAKRFERGESLGQLDGIPIPVKDELDIKGLPTSGGTSYRAWPATQDAWLVRALRNAGALVFAKTYTTEYGMNPWGMNPHFDMPRNVWDCDRGAGGSSTGAAVAVALGFAPLAVGSDGGGSIRIPAALNGVFGLKPTYNRVGRGGSVFGCGSVNHMGPIGGSVAEIVDFMTVVGCQIDQDDPATAWASDSDLAPNAWRAALDRGVRGCRIGVLQSAFSQSGNAVARACEQALSELVAAGAILVEVELPLSRYALAVGVLGIATETMGSLVDDFVAYGHCMGDDLRLLLRLMQQVPAREYFLSARTRSAMRRELQHAISEVDVICLPTTTDVAPRYPLSENRVAISDSPANQSCCRHNFLANLTGVPAASVPVGEHGGLPIGLQIIGDAWDEASVIAVMAEVERLGISRLQRPQGFLALHQPT